MRCVGQVQNVEGLESPGNIPLPSPVLPGCGWEGAAWALPLSSFLVVPGQKMLLFVTTWQIQFPLTQQNRFEPTNSCNNSGKCKKKKQPQRVKQFLVQVVCVIPKEMFTPGKLSQLQAPDPSSVQGWNLVFYIKLLQPQLNNFCLNFSWHYQEQNSSFQLIKAKVQTAPEKWKSRKARGSLPFNG